MKNSMLNFKYVVITLLSILLWIPLCAYAQQIVKGTVLAEGEPLIGVTVKVKDSSGGTITDLDGKYSVSVPNLDATLVFSFMGYVTEEIPIKGRGSVNVTMKENVTELGEVTIVGYGVVAKRDLTGAISSVTSKQIEQDASQSLEGLLQGKAAGVSIIANSGEPGGGITMRIRGQSSLNSGIEPLYIVDDVPIQVENTQMNHGGTALSPLANIDPSDIASIEVLKDAASASIYGSRAANGVVIITTKRGKSGKPVITFNASLAVSNIAKKKAVLNGRQYSELILDEYENAGDPKPIWQVVDSLNPTTSADNDWQSMVYQSAIQQKYDLGISGGTKDLRYAMSASYLDQEGTVINTGYKRIGTRINVDYRANKWLKVGSSTSINDGRNKRTTQGNSEASVVAVLTYPPVFSSHNPDGSLIGRLSGKTSPYAAAQAAKRNSHNNRIVTNEYIELFFTKNLRFKTNFAYDLSITKEDSFADKILDSKGQYQARTRSTKSFTWVNENLLFYNKTFNKKHNLALMAGYTQQSWQSEYTGIDGEGYSSGSITTLNAASVITKAYTQNTKHAIISYLARVNYDYMSRYLFTASIRRDGSSRFGNNKKYGNFPSVQLGWRFSDESWMKSLSFLSNGKIRFSYALTGNESIPNFITHGAYAVTGNYMGSQAIYPTSLKNPNLTWENTEQYNLGLDLNFLNNRINFIGDIYLKKTKDLLFNVRLPQTSGFGSVLSNLGNLSTKGLELQLNTVNIKGKFNWTSDFNISFDRTIVDKLPDGADILSGRSIVREGEPVGSFYGWNMLGVYSRDEDNYYVRMKPDGTVQEYQLLFGAGGAPFTGGDVQWEDINGDGIIDDSDRKIIGCGQPLFYGGFSNEFSYKGVSLNIYTTFSYGNDIYNDVRSTQDGMDAVNNATRDVLNRWRKPGDVTNVPIAMRKDPKSNGRQSNRWIEDGSYFKIKSVMLSYELPKKWISKAMLTHLRVYVSGTNLLTFSHYSGYDPEVNATSSALEIGRDTGVYPSARTFTFGLKASF